jgi:hypothetical protein
LPFIALLKLHVDVVNLDGRADFRLEKREKEGRWYKPADANAKAELDRAFARLTDNVPPEPLTLRVVGRTIRVPLQARGVARFSFRDLCLAPMAAVDYIAIAQRFHTLIIDDLPARFGHRNHVKRLCSLIDVLYERHVKLIVSADGDPHSIYLGMVAVFGGAIGPPPDESDTFPELLETRRAVSRLIEMRSCDYSAAELQHGPQAALSSRTPAVMKSRLRDEAAAMNAEVVIPSTRSRNVPIPNEETIHKLRNRIERCFNKLKHFLRFATRYDRGADYLFLARLSGTPEDVSVRPNQQTKPFQRVHASCI